MNDIIPFTADSQLPAHLADLFGGESNIAPRITINQLSVKGKVWRRIVNGEETQLTRRNPETQDEEPVAIVSLVVLDQNRGRSRAYYTGGYEEGKNSAPQCSSNDGVVPDADVKEPCAKTCASCPNSVKGSKITEGGKATTACVPFKRIAVVPTGGIAKHPVMLLKIAQTSIWDKENSENEAKGWFAWDQYTDMLRARGAKHTAAVETKVKFDLRVAYPKLLFSAARWLNPAEAVAAKGRLESDAEIIKLILGSSPAADGVTGSPSPEYQANKAAAPAADSADTIDAAAKQAEAAFAAEEAKKATAAAAAKEAKAKKAKEAKEAADVAAAAAKAAAAAALAAAGDGDGDGDGFGSSGDDDGFGGSTTASDAVIKRETAKGESAAAAATPVAPVSAVAGTPAGLSDLLSGWDA